MSSGKDENLVRITKDDLQRWIQAEVDKNPHLIQRREQLAHLEEWVKLKERDSSYTRLLYSKAKESVLDSELEMKGLYEMLGLEYRDEDSEEEGGEPRQEVIHIIDDDGEVDYDDDIVVIDLQATKETLEPMLEKMTVAIQKSSKLVQDLVQMVNKMSSINPPSNITNTSLTLTPETSHFVTPKLEITDNSIAVVKTKSLLKVPDMSSLLRNSEQLKSIASHNLDSRPSIKKEPELTPLTAVSQKYTPIIPLTKTEPKFKAETGSFAKIKSEPQLIEISAPPSDSKLFKMLKAEPQLTPVTSPEILSVSCDPKQLKVSAENNSPSVALNETEPRVTSSDVSSDPSSSEPMDTIASDIAGIIEQTIQTEPDSTSAASTELLPNDSEEPETVPNDDTAVTETNQTEPESTSETFPEGSSSEEGSKSSSTESSQAYKEIKLKVGSGVFGKRKHNLWCRGIVQEVQETEKGHRYKVEFKNGKRILLSAHHVALEKQAVLKDLFVGCRVVAGYKDDKGKTLFNAGVLVELPERKNRMRFLVFYDDGLSAYLALPDFHVVCKQIKKVWRDIQDEASRSQVKEYLRVYPNPIAVVLRVGQDTKAVRNGKFEACTVLDLDGSLIQIMYKKDKQKEWVYKGSNKLKHILSIKKRLSKEKPQYTVTPSTQQKTHQPAQQKTQKSIEEKSQVLRKRADKTVNTLSQPKTIPASFQPKVILQKLPKDRLQSVMSTSNLRSVKRPAPVSEEEEDYYHPPRSKICKQKPSSPSPAGENKPGLCTASFAGRQRVQRELN